MNSEILLESGTGEVEVLEFVVNGKNYAINVIKIKEILDILPGNLTKLPNANPAIGGLVLCRNEIITNIDLKYVLEKEKNNKEAFTGIVCEFNKVKVVFNIDSIIGVHRIKWEQILKPNEMMGDSLVIGNIILNNKIILFLDFEKIVTDISPNTGISENRIINIDYKDRSKVKMVLADDSPLIRRLLLDTLLKAGFEDLNLFEDGEKALNYLSDIAERKGKDLAEDVNIVITDIEMPQMDGLTLTRKIKEHPLLRKLPVIIFSSLITDNLRHKGESVGANAQLSKPEIGDLVQKIDELILK